MLVSCNNEIIQDDIHDSECHVRASHNPTRTKEITAADANTSTGGSGPDSQVCLMRSDMNVSGGLLRTVKNYIMGNSLQVPQT
jgi:hypothetical protein